MVLRLIQDERATAYVAGSHHGQRAAELRRILGKFDLSSMKEIFMWAARLPRRS